MRSFRRRRRRSNETSALGAYPLHRLFNPPGIEHSVHPDDGENIGYRHDNLNRRETAFRQNGAGELEKLGGNQHENPHQGASYYSEEFIRAGSLSKAKQLWGKELSYNNINDANGALELVKEFGDEPCVVACKHANPCGVGVGKNIYEAYVKAYESDPVSVFGGILAINGTVDEATATEINKIFIEIVIAEGYTDEALEILKQKKKEQIEKENRQD